MSKIDNSLLIDTLPITLGVEACASESVLLSVTAGDCGLPLPSAAVTTNDECYCVGYAKIIITIIIMIIMITTIIMMIRRVFVAAATHQKFCADAHGSICFPATTTSYTEYVQCT